MMSNDYNDLEDVQHTDVGRATGWLLAMFVAVAVLAFGDVIADIREGTDLAHVAIELAVAGIGLIGAGFLGRRMIRMMGDQAAMRIRAAELQLELEATQAEAKQWRANAQDLMRGLGEAIEQQFGRWELSPAEAEVALLLLKGLSHKEVAAIRGITPATARQQAASVYRKAGLGGKQELLAFFLEDLMLPGSLNDAD